MSKENEAGVLRGVKVWLRAVERRDLEAYHRAIDDPEIARLAGYRHSPRLDTVELWYERAMLETHIKGGFYFTICLHGEDDFVGTAWLHGIDPATGNGELSVFLSRKDLWGHGYGSDAVNVVVDYGFGQAWLQRIWLTVDAANKRAIRAYEKAGFVVEALMGPDPRRHQSWTATLLMALRREQWDNLPRRTVVPRPRDPDCP